MDWKSQAICLRLKCWYCWCLIYNGWNLVCNGPNLEISSDKRSNSSSLLKCASRHFRSRRVVSGGMQMLSWKGISAVAEVKITAERLQFQEQKYSLRKMSGCYHLRLLLLCVCSSAAFCFTVGFFGVVFIIFLLLLFCCCCFLREGGRVRRGYKSLKK